MTHKATITAVGRATHSQTGEPYLDVHVDIEDGGGAVVAQRRLGFPCDMAQEEILAEVGKVVAAFEGDKAIAAESACIEALNASGDSLAEGLTGARVEPQ